MTSFKQQDFEPTGYSGRFKLKRFSEIKISTARNYLIKELLPREGLVVIWGPPKCGKSFVAFDMAMHIALGREYRGRRVQQATVVYCALEGGGGFSRRIEAWRRKKLDNGHANIPFHLLDVALNLIADQAELIRAIAEQTIQPSAIFIDTLNRALRGDENSPEDMGELIRACGAIAAVFGCLVVLIHHCGVAGTRPRGHTSLTGAVDAQIAVVRDKDKVVVVTIEYMKDCEAGLPFACKLERIELGEDDDGDQMSSCIVVPEQMPESEEKSKTRGPKLTGAPKVAYEALLVTLKRHGQPTEDKQFAYSAGDMPGYTYSEKCPASLWRERFYEVWPGDKADTKKKAFIRAMGKLEVLHLIKISGMDVLRRDI
jgi:hypothetical protein